MALNFETNLFDLKDSESAIKAYLYFHKLAHNP